MEKEFVIHNFWASFGIPAYEEFTTPSEEEFKRLGIEPYPRITYDVVDAGTWGGEVAMSAIIHSRSSSWLEALNIKKEISNKLKDGGLQFECDGGTIWIKKALPFAQRMGTSDDDTLRQYLINISVVDHTN